MKLTKGKSSQSKDAIKSATDIKASTDRSVEGIKSKLLEAVGSRIGAYPALVVNLGDGRGAAVFEDKDSGTYVLFYTDNSGYNMFNTEDEVVQFVADTWEESSDIESSTSIQASVGWEYFDKFKDSEDKYLPPQGDGDTMATQLVTAVVKLIYKWFNDGDVFDNNYGLEGWANDLSSYANWIYKNIPECKGILDKIKTAYIDDDYTNLLKSLADSTLGNSKLLTELDKKPKVGSVYDADGPFSFYDYEDDEDDEYYDDEEDY